MGAQKERWKMSQNLSKTSLEQTEDFSSLLANTGLERMKSQVVFSPGEEIPTIDRIIVLRTVDSPNENDKKITRGRFVKIGTHQYTERLMNAATRNGDESSLVREPVRNMDTGFFSREAILPSVLKNAADSASELYDAYTQKGLTWLKSLTGIPDDAIAMIEVALLPTEDGKIVVPQTLQEFDDHLLLLSRNKFADYTDRTVRNLLITTAAEMRKAVRQALAYQTNVIDKIETELFNRRKTANSQGIQSFDDLHIAYFETLGRIPQDKQIADLAKRSNAAFLSALGESRPVPTITGANCPFCASDVKTDAVFCPTCRMWIDPEAEVAYNETRAKKRTAKPRRARS